MTLEEKIYFDNIRSFTDIRIFLLTSEFGASGYAVYSLLLQILYNNSHHKLPLKKYLVIAIKTILHIEEEEITAIINYCIKPCELFTREKDYIYSIWLNERVVKKTYIIKDNKTKLVKIGKTHNIEKRLNKLKYIHGKELVLCNYFEKDIEKKLHEKYKNNRAKGEWFSLSDEQIEEIKNMEDNK